MDLITHLAGTIGVDSSTAQALAGGLLGQVKSNLAENNDDDAVSELETAVPELGGWMAKAQAALGGSGDAGGGMLGGGGLFGAAASARGGSTGSATNLIALLGKLGLDADTVTKIAPVVLSFLGSRLSPEVLAKVKGLVPGLGGGEAESSGIGGMIGGLFG